MPRSCPNCLATVPEDLRPEEESFFREGLGDFLMIRCPGCGTMLALRNPYRRPVSLEQVTEEITAAIRGSRLALFCGAGISAPAGLPLGGELCDSVFEGLGFSVDEIDYLHSSRLPLEIVMSRLAKETDLAELLLMFEHGQPAKSHVLIANLARERHLHTIFTTNFDCLLESALKQVGLERGVDFEVLCTPEQFQNYQPRTECVSVVKLHGSADEPTSIAVTLADVSASVLAPPKIHVIESLFSSGPHDMVLVLGYSCSDYFDISPAIEILPNPRKKVLLIDHRSGDWGLLAGTLESEPLNLRTQGNPFRGFSTGNRFLGDTGALLDDVWKRFFPQDEGPSWLRPAANYRTRVDTWLASNREHRGDVILNALRGHLWSAVSNYDAAEREFSLVLKTANNEGNRSHEARACAALGDFRCNRNDLEGAVSFYERGTDTAKASGDTIAGAANLLGLGDVWARRLLGGRSALCYEEALRLSKTSRDLPTELEALIGLGLAYRLKGEPGKGLNSLRRAIELARLVGSKHSESSAVKYLGDCSAAVGDWQSAHDSYQACLDLAQLMGDEAVSGLARQGLGTACAHLGRCEEGIAHLHASLEVAERLGDGLWAAQCRLNTGNALVLSGRLEEAEAVLLEAAVAARNGGSEVTEGMCLNSLGWIYWRTGRRLEAKVAWERALSIGRSTVGPDSEVANRAIRGLDLLRGEQSP